MLQRRHTADQLLEKMAWIHAFVDETPLSSPQGHSEGALSSAGHRGVSGSRTARPSTKDQVWHSKVERVSLLVPTAKNPPCRMRCVSLICCAPGSRCCTPVSALVQKHRLASSAPLVRTILQVPRSAFVAGVLRRPLCRHTRQRAAPAIIGNKNRGYSHAALTEIVCMHACFPPRIHACPSVPR